MPILSYSHVRRAKAIVEDCWEGDDDLVRLQLADAIALYLAWVDSL